MMGFMTTNLSQVLVKKLDWARIDCYPVQILWDKLPAGDRPNVPMLPWMFGYSPNYLKAKLHWWEHPNSPHDKPGWWSSPDKEVSRTITLYVAIQHSALMFQIWLNEIRIPLKLLGQQMAAIEDAEIVTEQARMIIDSIVEGQELPVNAPGMYF